MATEYSSPSLVPPKSQLKQEHISFILITMTLFIGLYSFWEFQTRIWNRVEYNVGSWTYNIPFYSESEYSSQAFVETMLNRAILFAITSLIFNIAIVVFVSSIRKRKDSTRTIGIATVLSGIMTLVSFWNYKSIYLSPKSWFMNAMFDFDQSQWKLGAISLPLGSTGGLRFVFFSRLFYFAYLGSLLIFLGLLLIFIKRILPSDIVPLLLSILAITLGYIAFVLLKSIFNPWLSAVFVILVLSIIWILLQENQSQAVKIVLFYYVMIGFVIYTIIPVLYTIGLSMSSQGDINNNRFTPSNPLDNFIINYSSVIFILNGETRPSFGFSFMISLGLGFGTAIGGLLITLPAAYAISRFRFKGKGSAQFLVIATQMFPGIILLLPQFFFWKQLGFLDADNPNRLIFGVLLAYFVGALAYNVWMMRGYFDTLPRDLEEAALIDGQSSFGAFARIAIPLAAPGMVAVSIFTFLGAWNEFALAQIFIGEGKRQATLPLFFYQYQDTSRPDNPIFFQLLSAYSILAALPIVVIFLGLQKYLASGLTTGGVK